MLLSYIAKRIALMIPTLFGIMVINFFIVQAAPGGPIEQMLARISGAGNTEIESIQASKITGSEMHEKAGWNEKLINDLKKQYGFDRPPLERFIKMIKSYLCFDFGDSYFKNESVLSLILQKLPVSISLGLWTTIIVYFVSIPLGIAKAVRHGSAFDVWTSFIVIIGYAIPSFLFALTLVILFAGGSFWSWFPLRGLTSANWEDLSVIGKIKDYIWHITLPVTAQLISGFASVMILTKNSFLDEVHKNYVVTAMSQGFTKRAVLFKHIFKNAMLIIIAGLPNALIHILFSGSLIIEMIFSLDGIGLLNYESVINRDYPVIFASLYIFTLIGLVAHLIGDILYTVVDPRIDFYKRER